MKMGEQRAISTCHCHFSFDVLKLPTSLKSIFASSDVRSYNLKDRCLINLFFISGHLFNPIEELND